MTSAGLTESSLPTLKDRRSSTTRVSIETPRLRRVISRTRYLNFLIFLGLNTNLPTVAVEDES